MIDTELRSAPPTGCLARLRTMHSSLPDAERRVADALLDAPDDLLLASIARVAERAGVGVATVARLCKRLGYGGFPELKLALALELFNAPDAAAEPLEDGDDTATATRKVLRLAVANLEDTAALLDTAVVDQVARALISARRIELFAQGPTTGAVAAILQARLLLAGVACTAHSHVGYQGMAAGLLGPGDLAIGLSQSGATEPVVRALAAARTAGAMTACVTTSPGSPLAREVELCLLAASNQVGPPSYRTASSLAMLAVGEVLHAAVLLANVRSGR